MELGTQKLTTNRCCSIVTPEYIFAFDYGLSLKKTIGSRVLGGQGSDKHELVLNQMGRRCIPWGGWSCSAET